MTATILQFTGKYRPLPGFRVGDACTYRGQPATVREVKRDGWYGIEVHDPRGEYTMMVSGNRLGAAHDGKPGDVA